MKKVLLTGFRPFGGELVNPSELVLQQFSHLYRTLLLPVEYGSAWKILQQGLAAEDYGLVVMMGQAAGRSAISLERFAVNLMDSNTADEAGQKFTETKILEAGPMAYSTPFSLRSLVEEENPAAKSFVEISNSAGTFVCNELYYQFLHAFAQGDHHAKGLFMHLPYLPEQAAGKAEPSPSLPLEAMVEQASTMISKLTLGL